MIFYFTDGSAYEGRGSWAFAKVSESEELIKLDSGYLPKDATNNIAELQAVMQAIKDWKPEDGEMCIVSDSSYVVNCFVEEWYLRWMRNGWRTANGKVKNLELWQELINLYMRNRKLIHWKHIRGHAGNKWNALADQECTRVRTEALKAEYGESPTVKDPHTDEEIVVPGF